jgi:hypothetical protein
MRIRMLIEAEVPDDQIPVIAEHIAEQPVVDMTVRLTESDRQWYAGRFVGAQQVFD